MAVPSFITTIPAEVQAALDGVLTDVYSSEVRQDIVDALTWGINNTTPIAQFLNDLGLNVWDHKLCYTTEDVLPVYQEIPEEIAAIFQEILTDVYGPDLRKAIVRALRLADEYTSRTAKFIEDLGLTVVDGKLCAIFYPDGV